MGKKFWVVSFGLWVAGLAACVSIAFAEEAYTYDAGGKRDPFVPLVGVDLGHSVESLEDIISIEDVNLQGIGVDSKGRRAVIINGEMVKEGTTVGHLTVKKVFKNGAAIMIDEDEFRVEIYEDMD